MFCSGGVPDITCNQVPCCVQWRIEINFCHAVAPDAGSILDDRPEESIGGPRVKECSLYVPEKSTTYLSTHVHPKSDLKPELHAVNQNHSDHHFS